MYESFIVGGGGGFLLQEYLNHLVIHSCNSFIHFRVEMNE
jgi:hypothetical protein